MIKPPRYYIEKPTLSAQQRKEAFTKFPAHFDWIKQLYAKTSQQKYLSWSDFKFTKDVKETMSHEQAWFLVRQLRGMGSFNSPITYYGGHEEHPFILHEAPNQNELLHRADMELSGDRLQNNLTSVQESILNKAMFTGIIEESIASSQMEGAHTTRRVAKKMILEKRSPTNRYEQMIMNNYQTMLQIKDEFVSEEFSIEILLRLHHKLVHKTAEPGEEDGRLREDTEEDNEYAVQGKLGSEEYITHVLPPTNFVMRELQKLCDFANDEGKGNFIHPILKAILLHFWIGYLHPFTDGNGRLARSLFFWYLLKKGYYYIEYIPISTVLKTSKKNYGMAYIISEQDHQDLTYFVDFQLRKLQQAMKQFYEYVARKEKERKEQHLPDELQSRLNTRQLQVINFFHNHPDQYVTIRTHMAYHGITRQTAAKDLQQLVEYGPLEMKQAGVTHQFVRKGDF